MTRGGQEFFYHSDDQFNVMTLTNALGIVVERVEYDDYGTPQFFDGLGNPQPLSLSNNPYLFTGRRFDCGTREGWLAANLAFAMARDDMRDAARAAIAAAREWEER